MGESRRQVRVENLVTDKLEEFVPGMTLYVVRGRNNEPPRMYMCRFIRIERGTVVAEAFEAEHDHNRRGLPFEIRCRKKAVYLWGRRHRDRCPRCYWYDKEEGWR